jgi:hypothetical protein
MTELEKYIHTYFGVNGDELSKISSFFKPVSLKKGEYFLKAGRFCDKLGFVQSGIIREFVATYLLDKRTGIKIYKNLLGHFNMKATERYLHVSEQGLVNILNPLHDLMEKETIDW